MPSALARSILESPTESPGVTAADTLIDTAFFEAHPERQYYGRAVAGGWVLLVRRRGVVPALFRTWARDVAVPKGENAARALWQRSAWPRVKT